MRIFKVFLILVIYLTVLTVSENEAGMRIAFNDQLISNLIKWGAPQVMPLIQDLTIPDVHTSVKAGLIWIGIDITEINVGVTEFHEDNLKVDFQSPDTVEISLQQLKGKGHFKAKFSLGAIHDNESVDFTINKITLDIVIKMLTREAEGKKFPDADFTKFDIGLDFDFSLHGSAISGFINLIKPAIKGALTNTVLNTIKSQASTIMKQTFAGLPEYYPIQQIGDGIALNYAFLSDPLVDNDFLILNSYGSIVNVNITETLNPPFEIPTNLPVYDKDGKQIQLYASDYSINSILYTLYKSDLLKITVMPEIVPSSFPIQLTTSWLRTLIWGLDSVYGKGVPCEVSFKVNEQPKLALEEKLISVTLPTEMVLNVRKDNTTLEQAIKVDTEFVFGIDFHVVEEGKISAYIHEMKLQNTNIVESNVPKAKASTIENLINIMTYILRPVLNTFVLKKVSIQLPTIKGVDFSDSTVSHTSHYVAVNVNINFKNQTEFETMRVFPENVDELTVECPKGRIVKEAKLMTNPNGMLYYKYKCVRKSKLQKGKNGKRKVLKKKTSPFDYDEALMKLFIW